MVKEGGSVISWGEMLFNGGLKPTGRYSTRNKVNDCDTFC